MSEEMTFWDHVEALRGVLLRIALVIIIAGIGSFCAMPWLFDNFILAPCHEDFPLYQLMGGEPFNLSLISVQLASQFFTHMSASCWAAFIIGFPIIIYLLWSFVAPGLYEQEKRGVRRAFLFGNLMFYAGCATGYYLVFPIALRFLATYTLSDSITPMITLDSYMDNFFMLILAMGVVYELPLIAWLWGKIGVLTRSFFSRYRRHAIVALLVLAALITPTGDPFTLLVVFVPLYGLWEFGAMLVPADTDDDDEAKQSNQ